MLALLLNFLLPIPEIATNLTYSGYDWLPGNAPVRLQACEATGEIYRGLARSSTVHYGTAFTLSGVKTATRVRMRFTFADDHWQPVRTEEQVLEGSFTPGVKIMRTRRVGGDFGYHGVVHSAVLVLCSPIAIDYSDGTHWQWNPPASPYPQARASVGPSPTATPTRPPVLDYN